MGKVCWVWMFAGFGGTSPWADVLMCVSRRPAKEELFILRQFSRIDCFEFLSWSICAIDVGLSSCVPGRLAMAASLFRAMMCFLKTRVYLFLSCFPETMYFPLADVRSWKPVMTRSISGLVMQYEGG
jgi:hypothetical protein